MYDIILKHLEENGHITSFEAFERYGCTRLSQYIYLLRNDGYSIKSEIEKGVNRYGVKVHWNKYSLVTFNG